MVILKDINQNQTIHFITKAEPWDLFLLVNEQTKEVTNIEGFSFVVGDYTTALTVNLFGVISQDSTYTFELKNSINDKVVFRDKLFCTNQTNYSTVRGVFSAHTTLNEFIVYE